MLFAIATALLSLSALGCALQSFATWRLWRFLQASPSSPASSFAITFWRALKREVPDLAEKLDALAAATSPEDQLLIGVDAGSLEAEQCREWQARHPARDIGIVQCECDPHANPKIAKFEQMQPRARHAHWVLTDSEAILTREFVDRLRAEWLASKCDAITAGYRFVQLRSATQWLDGLPAALTLWPGLMLVPRLTFTLGACVGIRCEDAEAIGGWAALRDELAEDHELGQRLTAKGKSITLSRSVLDLHGDPLRFADYLRHQHRMAVTYRAANPWGAMGLPIFHVFPLAIAAIALSPSLWPSAVVCMGARMFAAVFQAMLFYGNNARGLILACATPVLESLFWLVAWWPLPVWWAGRWRAITWRGKLRPATSAPVQVKQSA